MLTLSKTPFWWPMSAQRGLNEPNVPLVHSFYNLYLGSHARSRSFLFLFSALDMSYFESTFTSKRQGTGHPQIDDVSSLSAATMI